MFLTIFTPSYNRASYLPRLFASLKAQTDQDFEFVLVDDGSTDDTAETAERFRRDGTVSFKFLRKKNGGLHTALNAGLKMAEGELFLFAGSDAWLDPNAVARVRAEWESLSGDSRYMGVVFRKMDTASGKPIGEPIPGGRFDCSHVQAHFVHGFGGDKAEFIRTELLNLYPYPEIQGESYFPVGYPYCRLSEHFILRYIDETIYNGQYLPGGLTSNFPERLRNNPRGFHEYYSFLCRVPGIALWQQVKWAVRRLQCLFNIIRVEISKRM